MNFPLFIAKRLYSDQGDKRKVSRPAIHIATAGVAIGLAIMIMSVCVVLGFKHTIRDKVIGFGSHIQVADFMTLQQQNQYPVVMNDSMVNVLKKIPGVKHVQKFAMKEGILKTDSDFLGVMFKGVGPDFDSTFIHQNMIEGSIPKFDDKASHNQILISQLMAGKLKLKTGERKNSKRVNESMAELTTAFYGEYVRRMLVCIDEMTTEMRENANGKEYFPDIFYASSSVIADIFEACGVDLPDYVRILYYNDYMGDESIGRAAIEKIELAWQADPSKFRVDKKQNRLIYTYPQDGPWYELKYIADELPNSLEAEISGGNQLIMNYEQAQELFGIKFRRWLGIFNL